MQHLIPFLGAKPLADITTNDLERYKRQRKEKGAASATIHRELAVMVRVAVDPEPHYVALGWINRS